MMFREIEKETNPEVISALWADYDKSKRELSDCKNGKIAVAYQERYYLACQALVKAGLMHNVKKKYHPTSRLYNGNKVIG